MRDRPAHGPARWCGGPCHGWFAFCLVSGLSRTRRWSAPVADAPICQRAGRGRELLCYLARAGCCVGGHVVFEQDHTVGNVEVVSDPPTTTTVETSRDRCRGRTRSINGEMGSRLTSSRILSSLIMKFVALVSSSTSRSDVPTSKASAMFAACEVEPEALGVEKASVVRPPGSSPIMAEMSTPETLLPSSALTLTASPRATTNSLPSSGTWL